MEQPLSEQTAADGSKPPMVSVTGENGTERQAEVASDSADLVPSNVGKNPPGETPHQSGDSQESVSVFKKKQLKFVSFRSRESIVNDSPLQRQDTVSDSLYVRVCGQEGGWEGGREGCFLQLQASQLYNF